MTRICKTDPEGRLEPGELAEAASAIRSCKIVAFPTDTVYGLGSTAWVKAAARRIYQLKGRDSMKPLPILVKSAEEARRWVEWTPAAEALAGRFWPGPLTLALRPTPEGRRLTFQEFPTLAVRVPAHPTALALLEAADVPIASSSANLSGTSALSSGRRVAEVFQDLADFIIDGGETPGVESTVVDASGPEARVLREGKVSRKEVLEAMEGARR